MRLSHSLLPFVLALGPTWANAATELAAPRDESGCRLEHQPPGVDDPVTYCDGYSPVGTHEEGTAECMALNVHCPQSQLGCLLLGLSCICS